MIQVNGAAVIAARSLHHIISIFTLLGERIVHSVGPECLAVAPVELYLHEVAKGRTTPAGGGQNHTRRGPCTARWPGCADRERCYCS